MSDAKIKEYLMYRQLVKKMLLLAGVWPIKKPSIIYRSLPYFQTALSLIMAYFIFGFVQAHSDNIALMIKGLSIMTSFFTIALKMACLIIYRDEVYELNELLDVYINNIIESTQYVQPTLENVTIFRRLTVTFVIVVVYSCSSRIVLSTYYNFKQFLDHVEPIKYTLIYPTNYPWNVPTSGYIFHLHYVFESLASAILCLVTLCVDSLFAFYIFQIVGQLRESIHCLSLVKETNNDGILIRKCVIQYQKLMKCRDIIEKIYGPMILWILSTNAVILCTVMFQITHSTSISNGQIGILATYISLKVIQTYMYAWSGTQLTAESENYGDAIYCSEWYGHKSFMSSVVIMLAQRPLILTACNFSPVSLNIFVMILNTTMSYFFLLQALETET